MKSERERVNRGENGSRRDGRAGQEIAVGRDPPARPIGAQSAPVESGRDQRRPMAPGTDRAQPPIQGSRPAQVGRGYCCRLSRRPVSRVLGSRAISFPLRNVGPPMAPIATFSGSFQDRFRIFSASLGLGESCRIFFVQDLPQLSGGFRPDLLNVAQGSCRIVSC